jgi:RNA polymerase sigma-70 factor (ECF subfamily)
VGYSEKTDTELALASAAGEERAFTELMRRYKEPLYRYIHRSMRGDEDAYDVLQESFASAWRSLDRYDASRKFSTWMYHTALNKVRDHGRKRAVRGFFFNASQLESPDRPDIADNSQNVSEDYAHRAELNRVTELIDALPGKLKQAFTLRVLQDLSQAEVADILGVSVKAVETRVYRARKILQEQVNALD